MRSVRKVIHSLNVLQPTVLEHVSHDSDTWTSWPRLFTS